MDRIGPNLGLLFLRRGWDLNPQSPFEDHALQACALPIRRTPPFSLSIIINFQIFTREFIQKMKPLNRGFFKDRQFCNDLIIFKPNFAFSFLQRNICRKNLFQKRINGNSCCLIIFSIAVKR